MVKIKIRDPREDDINWILSSWIKSWTNSLTGKCSCGMQHKINLEWATAAQHLMCQNLLKKSRVLVACNPDNIDQMLAYIVYQPDTRILHWLYTKHPFRQVGLAGALMRAAFSVIGMDCDHIKVTHWTHAASLNSRKWNLVQDTRSLK